jgi:hypothetical protein
MPSTTTPVTVRRVSPLNTGSRRNANLSGLWVEVASSRNDLGSSPVFYEFSNDATQMRFANKAHGIRRWIPSNSAFALFRPTLVLARHTKGEYLNATARLVTFFQNLVVWI